MPMRKSGETQTTLNGTRREFLRTGLAAAVASAAVPELLRADTQMAGVGSGAFELDEATVQVIRQGFESGKHTAHSVTQLYLARIEAIDKAGPRLNSVIEVNPDALQIADDLDRERHTKGPRGPLHGIPVLIKDNIATADRMQTTAGSLALVGSRPPKDSFVAQRLRAAGAVILGKTNLSEWSN